MEKVCWIFRWEFSEYFEGKVASANNISFVPQRFLETSLLASKYSRASGSGIQLAVAALPCAHAPATYTCRRGAISSLAFPQKARYCSVYIHIHTHTRARRIQHSKGIFYDGNASSSDGWFYRRLPRSPSFLPSTWRRSLTAYRLCSEGEPRLARLSYWWGPCDRDGASVLRLGAPLCAHPRVYTRQQPLPPSPPRGGGGSNATAPMGDCAFYIAHTSNSHSHGWNSAERARRQQPLCKSERSLLL